MIKKLPNMQNIPIRTEAGRAIRKAFEPDYTSMTGFKELEMVALIAQQTQICKQAGLPTDAESLYAFILSAHRMNKQDRAVLRKLLGL